MDTRNSDTYPIRNSVTYSINADRIKEVASKREYKNKTGIPISQLWQKTPLVSERAFRRNLADGKMKGETLLAVSKELNCTPYYFMEPSPMAILLPLEYWHYDLQGVTISGSRHDCFLSRGLKPDDIKRISAEDIDKFEALVQEIIDKYDTH